MLVFPLSAGIHSGGVEWISVDIVDIPEVVISLEVSFQKESSYVNQNCTLQAGHLDSIYFSQE